MPVAKTEEEGGMDGICGCVTAGRWNTHRRKKGSSFHHWESSSRAAIRREMIRQASQATHILSLLARSPEICGFRVETSGPIPGLIRGEVWVKKRSTMNNVTTKQANVNKKDEHFKKKTFNRSVFHSSSKCYCSPLRFRPLHQRIAQGAAETNESRHPGCAVHGPGMHAR